MKISDYRDDMFISRKEFYTRCAFRLKPMKKEKGIMKVKELYEEAKKDAPYRNHTFLLTKSWEDIYKMEVQEQDGLKDYNYKTEGERFEHIKKELIEDTYETIRIYRDIDHPTIMHLSNGFHRIFMAKKLGIKQLRVETWYGKWKITKHIDFEDLTGYFKQFNAIYVDMFRKAKKEDPEKIKDYPQLDTIDGIIEFCEKMTAKDKKNKTLTILGCYREREKEDGKEDREERNEEEE